MRDPLTADQNELLELLLREEGIVDEPAETASTDLSTHASPTRQGFSSTRHALSPTQQGLWLVEQISESATSAYNVTASFLLDGPLHPGAMDACCREILRRHPVLRTRFELHGDAPLVVVDAMDRRRVVPWIDLSALGGEIGRGEAERLARAAAARTIDLPREWPFRASLLRLAERRHALLLAVHHMVADGRSFQIVLRELGLLYRALDSGRAVRLAATAPLYEQVEAHRRRCFESGRLEKQLSYWRRRLSGLRLLELPTDRPRPRRPDPAGLRLLRDLDGELGRALLRLAREERVTPFMLLLAAFQTLLGRLAGQDDVAVGTAADARDRLGVGEVVGLFINTVVLRTDLSGRPSFRDLLARVRRVTSEAFESSDLPFDRLVAELKPEREAGRNPLFQVLFSVGDDTESLALPELPGLEVSSLEGHSGTAKVDLYVSILPGDPGWTVYAVLSRALFDATTVRRWLRGFEVLLRAIVEDPGRGVAELPVSTAAERHQVLREWSAGGAEPDAPEGEPVHELFTRVARGRPDRLAVESGRRRWSYAHLERVTERLAAHLVRLGTRPGDRVALLTERTPEMLAGLLGILRAGAAQVLLDPGHPPERLGGLLADAGVRVLLGGTRLAEELTAALPRLGCAVLRLEPAARAPETAGRRSDAFPRPRLDPAQAAYVIYTSGTTGHPKGTIVPHGALARLTRTAREDPAFSGYRRSLQFASISFDASVLEIYPCLTSGGTLVLRDEEMIATAGDLVDVCERLRLTMIHPPTAYWHHLVPEMTRDGLRFPPCLRLFIMGGEAARTETWREWRGLGHEHVELVNVYGPTEATAISSRFRMSSGRMSRGRPKTGSTVPVGRPIANARFFVLDPALCPVPLGAVGELAIAGAGLSWGYLGRGAQTAAVFVPDPFGERPGIRLYRTGDRVRWRGDGQLLFEGRRDRQLKLRGFRVEPAEIEAALARLPGVREAVVDTVVAEEAPGERRLVAWACARPGHELSAGELRDALARELPAYMVPAAFVFPESLPRTAGGKIDRRALPAPSFEAGPPPGAESGRHPLREMVTTTWAEVLGLEHVDEHDEFFALGGHSLLAMRLVARLREVFRCEIPLADLFHHSTPAGFAVAVERRLRGESGSAGLTATGRLRTPLSFAQRRLWLVQQLDPDNTAFNNTGAVRLKGPLHVAALDRGLCELVRRHQVLRATFHEGEDGPVQLVGPVPSHGLARVDLCRLPAERREAAAHREILAAARRVLDLERGPLLRAHLLVLGEGDVFLLNSIHHIVVDAWSEEILLRELAVLYQAFAAGREPLLGELPVQYGDYALWQEQRLGGELLDRLLTHWRGQLAGAAPAMTLPLDRPRPPVRGSAGDRELLSLPSERLETLRAFSRAEGVTLFMTILAAFEAALHQATEETDVLVGTNVAGRDQPGIEGLIGFFVNMVVLRTDLSGDPSFRELLGRVRETALQAWAHQELPFERLVEEMCPRRDPSLTPLVQVVVNFNQPGLLSPVPEFPGLKVERFETRRFPAHFDLILDVVSGDELSCSLVYSTALFEASTVRRLLSRFDLLLDLAVRDPELSLSRLRKETEKAWREKLAARRGSFRKMRKSPKSPRG